MDLTKYFSHKAEAELPRDEEESTMGIQSQKCKNSTQSIRDHPSHQLQHPSREDTQEAQQVQLTIQGERVFDPDKDCVVCKARKENKKKVPHRPHDDKCPRSRAKQAKENPAHKKLMEFYEEENNKLKDGEKLGLVQPQQGTFLGGKFPVTAPNKRKERLVAKLAFGKVKQSSVQGSAITMDGSSEDTSVTASFASGAATNNTRADTSSTECADAASTNDSNATDDTTMDAATLHMVLDGNMLADNKKPRAEQQKMIPEPILFMMQYIQNHFPDRFKSGSTEVPDTDRGKKAMKWYQ